MWAGGRIINISGGNARNAGNFSGGVRNAGLVHMTKTLTVQLEAVTGSRSIASIPARAHAEPARRPRHPARRIPGKGGRTGDGKRRCRAALTAAEEVAAGLSEREASHIGFFELVFAG
jgi:NAD(P)-dependent dehydrogenase (short-subunit alcohol dehydrogenase family)